MRRMVVLAALLVAVSPRFAEAETVTVHDFRGAEFFYTFGGDSAPVAFGSILVDVDGGTLFDAFCVDLFGTLLLDEDVSYDASVGSMIDWDLGPAPNGHLAAWLYNENNSFDDSGPDGLDVVGRTALQVAIWEALYDTGFDVSSGEFVMHSATGPFLVDVTSEVITTANGYLAELSMANATAVANSDAPWLRLQEPGCNGDPACDVQDFIGPSTRTTPVPEPSAALLLGLGWAGLAAIRRTRRD